MSLNVLFQGETHDVPEEKLVERENLPPTNVEYVPEQLELSDPALEAFSDVFARFQLPPEESAVCHYHLTKSLGVDLLYS